MKLKLCLVTLLLSTTLVACKSTKNDSVDLFAPVAGNEELASQEQTQDKLEENTQENHEESSNEIINQDGSQLGEFNSEEEKLANDWIQDSITNHEYAKEQQENPDKSANKKTEESEYLSVTQAPADTEEPTLTKTPDATEEPTVTTVPTEEPSVSIYPSSTPTTTPDEIIRPTNIPAPTKSPEVTNQPTNTPIPTKSPIKPTSIPVPTNEPAETSSSVLKVRSTTVTMGESKSSIIDKFGSPSRIDETEYNYEFYVYKGNYKNFMMIGIANSKVVAWYTDSKDFSYLGLTTSSKVSNINSTFNKNLSISNTLSFTNDGSSITFFMDTIGDSTIDGVYVASSSVSKGSTTKNVLTAWEKEVLDLTNSFRARNDLSSLTWSTEASTSARLHSEDMAKNNYFSHNALDGSTPYDRMKAQGISYKSAGENIIGGYGNAMHSNNGWVNSSGHRKNMLNSSYNYLGVGFSLGGTYGNYGTQNFFGK